MNNFAKTIMERTYSHYLSDKERLETWEEIATRVVKNVLKAVGIDLRNTLAQEIKDLIINKKFIPAGRYLYSSGNVYHQINNCVLLKAHDSREGWSELLYKASMALMSGGGVGVDYSDIRAEGSLIRKTGGIASGPISLMQIINECGRGIIAGGNRRSAIWAGLNWRHPDIHKFIKIKNWSPEIQILKSKDFSFPAILDQTNISVQLDDDFFEAYHDDENNNHSLAHSIYWAAIEQMLKTGEPGFTIDIGKNKDETLRNAPLSGDTYVLTSTGYVPIKYIVNTNKTIWTGKCWASNVIFKRTKKNAQVLKIKITGGREIKAEPTHEFFVEIYLNKICFIKKIAAKDLYEGAILHVQLPYIKETFFDSYMYTLGLVWGDGSIYKKGKGELTFCTPDNKKLIEFLETDLISSITNEDNRGYIRIYFKTGAFLGYTKKEYPILHTDHLCSWLAGLFDADGSYDKKRQYIRLSGPKKFLENVRRDLERIGILSGITTSGKAQFTGKQCYLLCIMANSVKDFQRLIPTQRLKIEADKYTPYRPSRLYVISVESSEPEDVFCCHINREEHSFVAEGVTVSNCGELSSRDTDDICNLGSINLSKIENIEEFKRAVDLGTAFLLAGTVYSDVPYSDIDKTRNKNRRLGLGLMGIHEWLLMRGKPYAPDEELGTWLACYKKSGQSANKWADEWGLNHPKKTRAIAPCGSISIIAETTGGIESVFCVAYKRRYFKGDQHYYQYVVDPVAQRLIKNGVKEESIEDAYTLARDVEKRVAFQAWVQGYVDHCISSTINLPAYGSELNNQNTIRSFGSMLLRYLPQLRGITCYPDGGRAGQPLTPVSYEEATKHKGIELVEETMNVCNLRRGNCSE